MKFFLIIQLIGLLIGLGQSKTALSKRSVLDQINQLNAQIPNLLNQNSIGDLSNLNSQIQSLLSQNPSLSDLQGLNQQLQSLLAPSVNQNLDVINNLSNQISSLIGPNIETISSLFTIINGVQNNNLDIQSLIDMIVPQTSLANFLSSNLDFSKVISALQSFNVSSVIDDLIDKNITDCLYDQLQDTTNLNPCVSNNAFLVSLFNSFGNNSLSVIDSFLGQNISTGLDFLTQSDFFGIILNTPQFKNFTECLIDADSNKFGSCLTDFPGLMNALNTNSSGNDSVIDLKQILGQLIKMGDFSKILKTYLADDLIGCLSNQLKNIGELNDCVLSNSLIKNLLGVNLADDIKQVYDQYMNADLNRLVKTLMSMSGLESTLNSYLTEIQKIIPEIKNFLSNYNLANLMTNESLRKELSDCLTAQMNDLTKMNDCVMKHPELKLIFSPNVLRNVSNIIQKLSSSASIIPGASDLLNRMGILQLANNLSNLARSIEDSMVTTTKAPLLTTSNNSIKIKTSSIIIFNSLIFVFFF